MISGYYGNYQIKMDAKGRIALPAKLRPVDSNGNSILKEFVLTAGLDGCAALFPDEEWKAILTKFKTLDFTQGNFRNFSRQIFAAAVTVTPDRQGRMLIPSHLRESSLLESDILIIGAGTYIEVWNPDNYKKYLSEYGQSYEEVAEDLYRQNRPPINE